MMRDDHDGKYTVLIHALKRRIAMALLLLAPLFVYGPLMIAFSHRIEITEDTVRMVANLLGVALILLSLLFYGSLIWMAFIFPKYRHLQSKKARIEAYRLYATYLLVLLIAWALGSFITFVVMSRVLSSVFLSFLEPDEFFFGYLGIGGIQVLGIFLIQQFKVKLKWDGLQKVLVIVSGVLTVLVFSFPFLPEPFPVQANSIHEHARFLSMLFTQLGPVSFVYLFVLLNALIRVIMLRTEAPPEDAA
ncbi:MAG: hypothetical protein ACQEQA_05215 [Bacillota bacterium]